ncbi:MAG: GHKL domain-containing protein [Bacteroidales bacterium]|nr:GHKL domain-containing protein [Bacteroidales bacterium]
MGRKKKPIFRLTLFFISAVLTSGSILAYLSINNISNIKELTEKRVEEEQKNLAVAVSDQIHAMIFEIADMVFDSLDNYTEDHEAGINSLDAFDLVEHKLVIDRNGNLLQPWFIDGFEESPRGESTKGYRTKVDQAEKAEFIEQDFKKARQEYLASLRASSNDYDTVQALNALARLSVKLEDGTQALSYYSTITSKYYALCDPNGFPYVYYAIPQLIRISNPQNRNRVIQEIGFCLSGMELGKIPMNHSTHDLLTQVSSWVEMEPAPHEKVAEIQGSIQKIGNRLSFIDTNAEVIREYVKGEIRDELPMIKEKYHALTSNSQDEGELILMNLNGDTSSGFAITIEKLWSKLLQENLIAADQIESDLELVRAENGINSSETSLVTIMEISPYFQGYQVLVKVKNENLINELVRRRSWIYGIALTLLLGGMVLGILLILRDISREEHLAQLRADFISNVTHELKTPLTSIQLFTESILLNRIKSVAHKKEYLQIILKETGNLKRMVNNILDFSRMEKGKREYHFETVNVTLLLNNAINDLDYWLEEKNFTLVKEIEDDVTAMVDQGALTQAIINLLNNAIKFSRNRKEIIVRLEKDQEMVLIQVEDKGIGIPDDQIDLIFQPFHRVGQKNSEDISGTGLGLSVVKEIVDAHQGKIRVESQVNEGSTFTILLKSTQENSV